MTAHSDNAAKQIIADQVADLVKAMENGGAKDSEKKGRLLGLIAQMVLPMWAERFVTDGECKERMSNCPRHIVENELEQAAIPTGWREQAVVTVAKIATINGPLVLILAFVFAVGYLKGWWVP